MKRTQIYLTENEHGFLKEKASLLGISKAELIRRILDSYIKDNTDPNYFSCKGNS